MEDHLRRQGSRLGGEAAGHHLERPRGPEANIRAAAADSIDWTNLGPNQIRDLAKGRYRAGVGAGDGAGLAVGEDVAAAPGVGDGVPGAGVAPGGPNSMRMQSPSSRFAEPPSRGA